MSQMPPDMARLPALFERQRQAFARFPMPPAEQRIAGLKRLRAALLRHREALVQAVDRDFSARSRDETLMAEVLTTVQGIDHTVRHLRRWMRPSRRSVSLLFAPARNRVAYQPLGVVGIMVPWNYPIQLALLPLVGALGAGNRAMIKLSEFTPATNQVLRALLADAFDEDEVAVIEGAVDVSTLFAQQPWDHLLFTGSTAVGRIVMAAAAKNLTPVTLELGGKSPVIVAPDAPLQAAAESIVFGKMLNAGQTCIAPDYALVPAGQEDAFVQAMQHVVARLYPTLRENPDYSAIVNERQHQRLQAWLDDAVRQGARVQVCNPAGEGFEGTRKMPLHLLLDVHDGMKVMQEEIFGPLLPVLPYRDLDQAVERVRSGARPLALYLFSHDRQVQRKVLEQTHSGGVTINDTLMHVAQDDLPFGGVGLSGMGHYHANEGFLTFSKAKGVHIKGRFNSGKLAYPPYGGWVHRMIQRWFIR
ncbi:coniferyl aldehyde dehydrogenase [Tepidicella baoligensis]|uniref:coniferyl aldehyde dehydrogenase n=1 Tax=Tepidicella baoligensis TaxID=2707016 RepID=UPI0015D9A6CF|nr:coniferyl aldehyde dehydrogenase [Tepidicella baoligensis]